MHFQLVSPSTRDVRRFSEANVVESVRTARSQLMCLNSGGPRVPEAENLRDRDVRECHSKQHLRHRQRRLRKVSVQLQYSGDQHAPN